MIGHLASKPNTSFIPAQNILSDQEWRQKFADLERRLHRLEVFVDGIQGARSTMAEPPHDEDESGGTDARADPA